MHESSQFGIHEMVDLLDLEKNNRQKVLLLGSRAGQLFRSAHFYNHLQPFSKRNFYQLSLIERFQECHSILTSDDKFTEREVHSILQASLKAYLVSDADMNLASLIKDELFNEIITTNIDDGLEDALSQIGMREGWDYEVVRIGYHAYPYDHKITRCRIIKPFGDLLSQDYTISGRSSHVENPKLSTFLSALLRKDVLIVGLDLTWDRHILPLIPQEASGNLWFVSEEEDIAEKSPDLHALLQARKAFKILGRQGSYDYFLSKAYQYRYRSISPPFPTDSQVLERIQEQLSDIAHQLSLRPDHYTSVLPSIGSVVSTNGQNALHSDQPLMHADVLLVTVTEIETTAVLEAFQETCKHDPKRHFVGIKTYYELGKVNGVQVFLVQSEMGVSGPGGSLQTVRDGIEALSPTFVIMVGIAFGTNPYTQRIGDVLVSKQLYDYGHQRFGTNHDGTPEVISRGDRVTCSIRLLDRCRSASIDWRRPPTQGHKRKQRRTQVLFGTILSGEKLIDNAGLRDQLLIHEPGAIGGEMEGVGLYSAAQNLKVEWILVKAICDWADGNKAGTKGRRMSAEMADQAIRKTSKEQNQQKRAAKNAAEFVIHVLLKTKLL
jgi:nucleoside phosphorylase